MICASVWMTRSIGVSAGDSIVRCSALTIPAVTERSSPNGFPIATTASPTWTPPESPSSIGVRARAGARTFNRARSVARSEPTIVALMLSLFEKLTSMSLAPAITW